MGNVINIRMALEQLGTGWKFGGSVTDGTQEAWQAVTWEDKRVKPAWADLCAAHIATIASRVLAAIDSETSAAIIAGFDYVVDGVSYHFSYDAFDQQNFADTANVALLAQMGGTGLPESVNWNAYKNWQNSKGELVRLTFTAATFLTLYTAGAVAHKAARMAEGGARKAALAEAVARGATAEELEAI
ncbi:MAG: hypothetical protein F8N36_09150 [Desulfovibrio sp.]|uniref:hypothetical protein n=1 Tax=Desulfovibrio sp. TaxID=885 RepID=UPI00135E9D99|nr:hypothetical protein [Desulfovibrio sp.]MTJ93014.1 hypothetical protein [Desulfovibrio sp.]